MPEDNNKIGWQTSAQKWFSMFVLIFAFGAAGCASMSEKESDQIVAQEANQDDELGPYEQQSNEPTVVAYEEYKDPLKFINRPIFTFNHYTYRYLLTPLSRGYQYVVPKPVDKSVGNFFFNLREPLYFLNNLFQWKPAASGKSLLRFGINSTLGLFGLFDPAAAWWDITREETTFGDTLARYGVGYGAYLVLPLLGPSDLRDATSITFEYFAHPLNHIEDEHLGTGLLILDGYHKRIPELARYPDIIDEAEDPYIFMRNLYLQGIQRDAVELQPNESHPVPATE